jgi:RimJ/RimL family protein N-acetyltransferase
MSGAVDIENGYMKVRGIIYNIIDVKSMENHLITGEKIYLRSFEKNDMKLICKWHNDDEIMTLFALSEKKPEGFWFNWFEKIEKDPSIIYFGLVKKSDDKLIGYVHLEGISWQHKLCRDIGILIGEKDEWSKGFGTEGMNLMIRYAFKDLGLHRLELMTFPFNKRGLAVWKKCGFTKEGIMRNARFVNGKWQDVIFMSLLEDEYKV